MRHRRLGTWLVFWFSLAATSSCWGVDIPFEFFYGRWVRGHQPSGQLELHKGNRPTRSGDYQYTSEKWRVGLAGIRGKVLWRDDDGRLSFPVASLQVRPGSNWQIGLGPLIVSEYASDRWPETAGDYALTQFERSTDLELSFGWIRSGRISIPEHLAPFSYFVRPQGDRGLKFDGKLRFRDRISSTQFMASNLTWSKRSQVRRWQVSTSLTYGFKDILAVSLESNLLGDDIESVEFRARSQPYFRQYSQRTQVGRQPQYRVESSLTAFEPFYAVVSFGQTFREYTEETKRQHSIAPDTAFYYHNKPESEWTRYNSTLTASLYYLNRGRFQSSVILDDYSGYYHNMLFHGQTLVKLDLAMGWQKTYRDSVVKNVQLDLAVDMGWWDLMQAGIAWAYGWRYRPPERWDRERYSETSTVRVAAAVRSYRYRPGQGPGWERDTPEDIAFGPIPPLGHLYFSATYKLPTWSRRTLDEVGFLALEGLDSDHTKQLVMSLTVGLGRGFILTAKDEQWILHSSVWNRDFTASLSTRVLQRWHAVVSYSQRRDWYRTSYPTVRLELNALL